MDSHTRSADAPEEANCPAYEPPLSHLGGLLGLVISIVTLVRQKIHDQRPSPQP